MSLVVLRTCTDEKQFQHLQAFFRTGDWRHLIKMISVVLELLPEMWPYTVALYATG
jgi:hypothetical protein